jgi:RHS repeat-associated protein
LLEAFYAYERMSVVPTGWHGSLMEDKQDRTRTLYRRNRADDPNTGRFTQEDPGGLAGGLNLYGYAAGDPVNFSDPFGLDCRVVDTGEKCPKTKTNWGNVVKTLGKHALILGFALLTEGAGEFAEFAEASEALGAGETLEGGAAAASTAEGEAAATSEAVEGAETREVVKTRPNPGRDGGTSRHIIEKEADGTTRSVTHQVEKNGEILHQHQTHIGKYGSQRRFPDAWIKYPTVPQ